MKRSAAVVLIGVGAAALSACGKHDDCKDNDPNSEACRAGHSSATSHSGGLFGYFGGGGSSSSSSSADAESGTSRGGIGATGEGHASAGGEGGGHGGGGGE